MANIDREERDRQIDALGSTIESMTSIKTNMLEVYDNDVLHREGVLALVAANKEAILGDGPVPSSWQLARDELKSGFAKANAFTVITLWSMFEVSVEDLIVTWLGCFPDLKQVEPIAAIVRKGKVQDANTKQENQNILFNLKLRTYADCDIVETYENIFILLDLRTQEEQLPDNMRKDLLELFQVRNLLIHRGGLVDARFMEKCGWITGLRFGEKIHVTDDMNQRYRQSAVGYTFITINRVSKKLGIKTE